MSRTVLLIILAVNCLISVLYLIVSRFFIGKGNRRDSLIRFVVMIICPVIAPCIFLISWILLKIVFHKKVDLDDVIFSKDREKTYRKADEQAESNLVPLEEALAVTDQTDTRALMLDVIRRDVSNSLRTISLALQSDDSEVSHYSASILQSTLGDFRKEIQTFREEMLQEQKEIQKLQEEKQPTGSRGEDLFQTGRKLLQEGDAVLRQHVLTDQEQLEYTDFMDDAAALMTNYGTLDATDLERLCRCLMEAGKYDRCRYWADLSAKSWPKEASSYTNYLKLYYKTGQRELFLEKLKELEASDIDIDHQTLEVIRLFRNPENQGRRESH